MADEVNQLNYADNLLTIDKGVYGEDVRQAIKENIMINHSLIDDMNTNIASLQNRVDALVDSGGGSGGGDQPGPSPTPSGSCVVSGSAYSSIDYVILSYVVAGEAIAI